MNDRLRFRAWDRVHEKWIDPFMIVLSTDGEVMAIQDLDENIYGLHQVELIQCTGRKDKNGKLIFEGHCVQQFGRSWVIKFGPYCDSGGGDSASCGHGFYLENESLGPYDQTHGFYKIEEFEIIGNIHDNPDLISGNDKKAK